jgi:hypothetical protein
MLAGSGLALAWWCLGSHLVWNGPVLINHRQRMHDSLAAASFVARRPAGCGIGLYGLNGEDWGVYGGYTYFHRPAPMYWPEGATALIAAAGAFDTLLYTQPPPPALGFDTVRCIGEVCIAQRSGGCVPMSMTPIPVPDALADRVPRGRPLFESEVENAVHSRATDRGR